VCCLSWWPAASAVIVAALADGAAFYVYGAPVFLFSPYDCACFRELELSRRWSRDDAYAESHRLNARCIFVAKKRRSTEKLCLPKLSRDIEKCGTKKIDKSRLNERPFDESGGLHAVANKC
jgi:hypothetical protein